MMNDPSTPVARKRPDFETKRRVLDPWRPGDSIIDSEPNGRGGSEACLTLFLTGSECPLHCVFCDLSQYTLLTPTPEGAITTQIEKGIQDALHADGSDEPSALTIKLYNASNLFENRAVPAADDEAILNAVERFRRVVIECHPRWIGDRFEHFVERLGDRLEIAMGLETCHPDAFPKLGKGIELDDFDRAARHVVSAGATLRTFVLLGAPFVDPSESERWAVRSVEHSADLGARFVSLIPLRPSPRLHRSTSAFEPQTLASIESALERSLAAIAETRDSHAGAEDTATIVAVDPWDLADFADCSACLPARTRRLEEIQRRGRAGDLPPSIRCSECSAPHAESEQSIHTSRSEANAAPSNRRRTIITEGERS